LKSDENLGGLTKIRLGWVSAALALFGCGSDLAPDPTMIPIGAWANEFAAAYCAKIFACCDRTERSARWSFANEVECRRLVAQDVAPSNARVAAGLLTYDARAARRCIDEIDAVACGTLFNHPDLRVVVSSCNQVMRGARKLGEPCQGLDSFCESANCLTNEDVCGPSRACPPSCGRGFFCDEAVGCTAAKPAGGACATTDECESTICALGVCGEKEADGATCLGDAECASGTCSRPVVVAGTCGPPLPDGAVCYTDSGCAGGTCGS
jgi:hypothetical protein